MVNNKALCSLIIICFILFTIQNSVPMIVPATAKKLADDPQSKGIRDLFGTKSLRRVLIGVDPSTSGSGHGSTG